MLKYGSPKPSYNTLIETLLDPFKEPIKDARIRFLKGFKPSDAKPETLGCPPLPRSAGSAVPRLRSPLARCSPRPLFGEVRVPSRVCVRGSLQGCFIGFLEGSVR